MSEVQQAGVGFDYYTAGTQPSEAGVVPAQRNTLRVYDLKDKQGRARQDIGGWEITLNDFSQQGYNHPEGPFSRHSNGYAWSEFITSKPNELVPPIVVLSSSRPGTTSGDRVGVHHAQVFDTVIVGCASGNNASLSKPTSSSNPALTAIAYSPAASICSLTKFKISGAERLLVGRVGSAAQILSDSSGTVETTMNADTASLWGCIVSGVNSGSPGKDMLLLYAGTSLRYISSDATLTAATTSAFTVPAGGFAVGAVKPKGRAEKAVWAFPKATNTSGALKQTAEALMELWVTDMELATMDPLRLKYLPNGIRGAVIWRDGVVAFDDTTVVYWDGDREFNLSIFAARVQPYHSNALQTSNLVTSDYSPRVRALRADGPELYCIWQRLDNVGGQTQLIYCDQYKYESGTWHSLSEHTSSGSTGTTLDVTLCGQGGAPFDFNTRAVYFRSDGNGDSFFPFYLIRAGESHLYQNSEGSGSYTTNVPQYSVGDMLGPKWWLDGIKRNYKVVTEVEFDGNLDHGGSGVWTFEVAVYGGQQDGTRELACDVTFSQGKTGFDYVKKNTLAVNIQDVQVYLVATTATTIRTIPTLLPVTIRGVYAKQRGALVTPTQLAEVMG